MEDNSALEEFRQRWRQEVNARSQGPYKTKKETSTSKQEFVPKEPSSEPSRQNLVRPPSHHPVADLKDDDLDQDEESDEKSLSQNLYQLKNRGPDDDEFKMKPAPEPKSALEHYERAVQKEIEGKLGDSVSHYRKAYRLDDKVDQTYKNKHFAAAWKSHKTAPVNPIDTPVANSSTTPSQNISPVSLPELIDSFAGLSIPQAEPVIKGDLPPPCPIRSLPSDILHEIYLQIALTDPACFTRLALVCKRFTYDVFTDMAVWRRVALGPEFGLASQKYDFYCDVQGRELIHQTLDFRIKKEPEQVKRLKETQPSDWREVFHSHPRIRFNGVYISTVNYTRAGHGSATSAVWNSPVHIVTYYRYLRFFRDGTVISLLTTHDPAEVVHHLTKENMELVRLHPKEHHISSVIAAPPIIAGTAPSAHLPPTSHALMKHALRGRWRLCHPSVDREDSGIAPRTNAEEGDVHIETEGVGPRYMYTMHLCLKSGSRSKTAIKNNKLQWKGFWSYNNLTNDWAEFQLKNDRAFVFSRVRSYGMGY
ncbi:putative f-box protein [Phaeomoniella chlamydospora]|uniref:Putative f-box protein n=1 Tax=Phaeomoniella chlamydospora TaxID=158046 RepID=A0A0G2EE68_PHACM|nr:putative f-box protein [Phaeomoniella chlamydospora]